MALYFYTRRKIMEKLKLFLAIGIPVAAMAIYVLGSPWTCDQALNRLEALRSKGSLLENIDAVSEATSAVNRKCN
jgi:hypothetical protein